MLETVSYGLVALLGLYLALRSGRRLLGTPGRTIMAPIRTLRSIEPRRAPTLMVRRRPISLNLVWAGAATVLAMSEGTAITVAILATSSVCARRSAVALTSDLADGGRWVALILDSVAMLGGILIVLLGLALLHGSLSIARHPLL